ncbi:hypothetical protein BJY01DRAFT_252466 [Aspergillus pseudoustus]|uniref:Zn(2)-C6 fungal-type domain-containing protein n=1 Tax=Aspergillus pseudoustus TaxID=1810923 RepID=A0ABR4J728_9EURO
MEPKSKRLRVLQACEPCRSKKGKCDGQRPVCRICKNLGIECSYNPNPKKRGLRPGQLSSLERRALLAELVAAYLLAQNPGAEENVSTFFSCSEPGLAFLAPGAKRDELDQLLTRWRQGTIAQWLFQSASAPDASLDELSRFRSQREPDARPSKAQSADPPRSSLETNANLEMKDPGDNSNTPTIPNVMNDIFDIYFAYTHTWLPFVDKYKLTAFARSLSGRNHQPSELNASQSASCALMWAMAAHTSLHAPASYWTSDELRPRPMMAARQALSLLPRCDKELEQGHVQALILLALFYYESGNRPLSWRLIGMAGRSAVDLSTLQAGQHLSSPSRRTSLACFVVEGIIAAGMNRKSQLPTRYTSTSDMLKTCPPDENIRELEEEGWEEWSCWEMPGSSVGQDGEPFRVLSTFNQTVQLVEILNDANMKSTLPQRSTQGCPDFPPGLVAWSHCIDRPNVNGTNHDTLQSTNVQCVYWLARCILRLQLRDSHRDVQESHKIASAVSELATRYQAAYPVNSAPVALLVCLRAAQGLLQVHDPLGSSLAKSISGISQSWAATAMIGESTAVDDSSSEQAGKLFTSNSSLRFPAAAVHAPLDQATINTPGNHLLNLGMDVQEGSLDDSASLSAADLTALDAAVWDDDLFTRNLGFLDGTQSALELDLSHCLNPPT